MEIINNYREKYQYRESFFTLAKQIFSIDFHDWYNAGYWNDNYRCYSFIDNNTVISNASVSSMKILQQGKIKHYLQIGTVMTHPSYRGRGLAGKLIKHICKNSPYPVFLFAEAVNSDFYQHLGFSAYKQYSYIYKKEENTSHRTLPIEHWDMKQQQYRKLLFRQYKNKEAFNGFDVLNGEHILFFHLLYDRNLQVGYFKEINSIVIYKINRDNLNIYEIISSKIPLFQDIIKCMPADSINTVRLMFTPPANWLEYLNTNIINDKDNLLFVSNEHMFPKKIHISPIYVA